VLRPYFRVNKKYGTYSVKITAILTYNYTTEVRFFCITFLAIRDYGICNFVRKMLCSELEAVETFRKKTKMLEIFGWAVQTGFCSQICKNSDFLKTSSSFSLTSNTNNTWKNFFLNNSRCKLRMRNSVSKM
jgi:hypothetical protein